MYYSMKIESTTVHSYYSHLVELCSWAALGNCASEPRTFGLGSAHYDGDVTKNLNVILTQSLEKRCVDQLCHEEKSSEGKLCDCEREREYVSE